MSYSPGTSIEIPDLVDGVPNRRETIHTAVDQKDPRLTPVPVSRDIWNASFDPAYRKANPFVSGRNRLGSDYRSNMDSEDAKGYDLGQSIRRAMGKAYSTDGRALLTNAGGGAAVGLGGAFALDQLRALQGKPKLGWKSKVLAALLGTGAGVGLTMQMRGGPLPRTTLGRQKEASAPWQDMEPLRRDIMRATASLDFQTRDRIQGALVRLSPADLVSLRQLIATATGAAAGAMVARWLAGKGLIPMLIGGTVGGLLGRHIGGSETNAFGRRSLDAYR